MFQITLGSARSIFSQLVGDVLQVTPILALQGCIRQSAPSLRQSGPETHGLPPFAFRLFPLSFSTISIAQLVVAESVVWSALEALLERGKGVIHLILTQENLALQNQRGGILRRLLKNSGVQLRSIVNTIIENEELDIRFAKLRVVGVLSRDSREFIQCFGTVASGEIEIAEHAISLGIVAEVSFAFLESLLRQILAALIHVQAGQRSARQRVLGSELHCGLKLFFGVRPASLPFVEATEGHERGVGGFVEQDSLFQVFFRLVERSQAFLNQCQGDVRRGTIRNQSDGVLRFRCGVLEISQESVSLSQKELGVSILRIASQSFGPRGLWHPWLFRPRGEGLPSSSCASSFSGLKFHGLL